jgi:DNA-binding transcriptional ArsR family regulator
VKDSTLMPRDTQAAPDLAAVLSALTAKLSDMEIQLKRLSSAQPPTPDRSLVEGVAVRLPKRTISEEIVELLKLHGKLTTADLIEKTQQTKSAVHYHIGLLEDHGAVVVVRGKRDPETGRRGPDVVYTADSLVT